MWPKPTNTTLISIIIEGKIISENCGQCILILDRNFQTRKQYRYVNWNIREITDGKLHLNNMKREDCPQPEKLMETSHSKKGQRIYFHFIQHYVHRTWKRPSWSFSHWPKMDPSPTSLTLINKSDSFNFLTIWVVSFFLITTWPYFWSIMDAKKFLQVINRWQTILVWFYDWMLDHRIVKCKVSNRKYPCWPGSHYHTGTGIPFIVLTQPHPSSTSINREDRGS